MDSEVQAYINYHEQIHKMESKALELQALEYERRLDDLNHAHRKSEEDKAQFVSKQVYEGVVRDLRALLEVVREKSEDADNESKSNKEKIAGLESSIQWLGRMLIGAIVVGLIAFLIRIIAP